MRATRALAIVRIALGAIFLARTTGLFVPLGFRFAQWPLLGWPDGKWHIAFVALPSSVVMVLAVARTIAAACFLLGYRARAFGIVASLAGYAVLAQDALAYVNSLHLLFLSTLVVALTDCSSELAVRKEPPRSVDSSTWLVRATPMSVYAFSAIAKLNAQFLSGRALLAFCADGAVHGLGRVACASPPRAELASLLVVATELALPVALFVRRTRRAALVVAVALHVGLELSIGPDVLGWTMLALLVSFAIE